MADARLLRQVSLDETAISLDELLRKVSGKELHLSCSRSCEAQKVQVHLKDRPLRLLMEALAELLPGSWESANSGTGYTLIMDSKAVSRRDQWWRLYLAERERALSAQRDLVLQQMRRSPYRPKPGDPNPEQVSDETFNRIAAKQEFWNTLPGPLQERIANQIVDNAFYRSGPFFLGTTLQEGAVALHLRDLPQQAQSVLRNLVPQVAEQDAIVRFSNGGYFVKPAVQLSDGKWNSPNLSLAVPFTNQTAALPLDHHGLPNMVRHLGRSALLSWKQLAAYQESHVWDNDRPDAQPPSRLPPRRAEVLQWLADQANVEFVADFYSTACNPMSPAEKKRPLSRPVKDELDYRAAEQDMSWKRRSDGIYLFRDNRWYRDDYLEVPGPTLKRLLDPIRAAEKVDDSQAKANPARIDPDEVRRQLDTMAEIVTALSRWQIGNGLYYYVPEEGSRTFDPKNPSYSWRPFVLVADRILSEYNTICFYAGLEPSQRSALVNNRLDLASLSPVQARQALFVLPELQVALESGSAASIRLGLRYERPLSIQGYGYMSADGRFPLEINLTVSERVGSL